LRLARERMNSPSSQRTSNYPSGSSVVIDRGDVTDHKSDALEPGGQFGNTKARTCPSSSACPGNAAPATSDRRRWLR
jgi:hypothetical protein